MSDQPSFLVFSGTNSKYLTEKICQYLGRPMGKLSYTKFSDGEFSVSYDESIRGHDVFLVQSTNPSADNLMELLLMIDAAKRASARHIIAVIPYYGWARQDRKDKPRVSIAATSLFQYSCRPSLRIQHPSPLHCIPSFARSLHCSSRCRRFQACQHLCKISAVPSCALQ